ncbi:C4-dicarboxylate ABC transporter permease [Pacificitalea manganoxidans]|uniref:TRAP transporter small permease protein n=1 Tax=Pacificitalea manganoxidans TaxID=1411902 RepID=A0A291LWI6_9RHOB|nr:TRAP transporter small permease [Pacificitalea manganoxidans]ATI41060.1 C4-dicarboxylate ABC transporter permease [Pacificitalea manganoxidans]MDR6308426.1 TRAP-type C4-dicarboxylate transport system permease small subunit [Pacificitalea manganoxidans]OWU70686.1 C4-dicarboxylate ABC transporter permease [Roseovarius sp. 22II1-1F6A]
MAGASSVLEDGSTLSRLDRTLFRIETVMALVSGLAVFSLMLLAVLSVGGRHALNQPLPGYVDWIQQAMPVIAVFGVAYVQRLGGHIRMDIVVGNLKGRALWSVEFLSTLVVLILAVLLVWGSWAHFARSFDFSQPMWSRDSSFDIRLPLWPAKLVVPVALAVLCLRLTLQLWAYGRAIVLGLSEPVAVPLIEDAATQAAAEAETVSGFDDADDTMTDRRGLR